MGFPIVHMPNVAWWKLKRHARRSDSGGAVIPHGWFNGFSRRLGLMAGLERGHECRCLTDTYPITRSYDCPNQ